MICYKASQVVSQKKPEVYEYDFKDNDGKQVKGSVWTGVLTCIGAAGGVAEIKIKAKTEEEAKAKLAKYPTGKPADIPLVELRYERMRHDLSNTGGLNLFGA